jgi:hypothetical protein
MSQANSIDTTGTILRLSDYRQPPPKRVRIKSQYEKYPLPFFNRKKRCTWDIQRSGNYRADCETGAALAKEFLASNDGTHGWHSLLQSIVTDMIRAGPPADLWPDGKPHSDGVVIGFIGIISSYVMAGLYNFGPPAGAA